MWRSNTARQLYVPNHGDAILVHGYVSIYEAGGQYQLYADQIQPVGRGDLHREFELLKNRLEAEGLFDAERKRPLPGLPRRIGVVTSPTAAAFQDVLNVLARRYPLAEVLLSPTLVQGNDAPPQIVAALDALNRTNVDVILMVRGGGSLEDLWAFNDERVARAVAASRLPVVSGVGHEIDFTIVDFVADRRAPTPSAAAEVITPYTLDDLAYTVDQHRRRLADGLAFQIDERRRMVEAEARILASHHPQRHIDNHRQRLDDLSARTSRALGQLVRLRRERLDARHRALLSADPRRILQRGYAIVETGGVRLADAQQTAPGAALDIHLARGMLRATVTDTKDES
jgi:exodeoxyribonuclease VII large subunit